VLPSLIALKISSSIEDLIASVSWYALIALKKRSGIGCWIGMVMNFSLVAKNCPISGRRNLLTWMARPCSYQ
jgi:hypothetical protein